MTDQGPPGQWPADQWPADQWPADQWPAHPEAAEPALSEPAPAEPGPRYPAAAPGAGPMWPAHPGWSAGASGPGGAPPGLYPPPNGQPPYGPLAPYTSPTVPAGGPVVAGRFALHPMGFGELLDMSVKLLRATAKSYLLWLVVVIVPFEAVIAYAGRNSSAGYSVFLHLGSTRSQLPSSDEYLELGALAFIFVLFPVATCMLTRAIALAFVGKPAPRWPPVRTVKTAAGLVVASIAVHCVELAGLFLFVLPALVFMAFFSLTAPAIVIERLGPFSGMGRSWKLVASRFWGVLGTTVLGGILAALVSDLILLLPQAIATIAPRHVASAIDALLASLGVAFQWCFMTSFATLLYLDQRVRREGLDLEAMVSTLG